MNKFQLSVLYVEDECEVKKFVVKMLRRRVEILYVCNDGVEGLELFKRYNPDIVITDINMPHMDGLTMSREIKTLNKDTPIVILSAYNDFDRLSNAIEAGVDRFITKPINTDILYDVLSKFSKEINLEKDAKEQLKLLEEYKYAIDATSIVTKTDIDGKIIYANDKFCEISGYSREELIGNKHTVIKHPDTDTGVYKNLWETILSKKIYRNKIKSLSKDGKTFVTDLSIVPILDYEQNIREFIAIRQDMTEIYYLQKELQKAKEHEIIKERENAQKLAKAKDSFLIVFTHELKTPLNAIINLTKYSIKTLEKVGYRDIVSILQNVVYSGTEMMHTVANILEIGRLKSNKLIFNIEKVRIDSIIKDIHDNYKNYCLEHNITIDSSRVDSFEIMSDRQMIRQLILNLFSNAIKYGQGKILISANITNSTFEISVEDNGSGIDDDQKAKIFNLFEQGDKDVMTRRTTGTGVGLYFVKLLSDELNFSITIEKSILLGGAKFILKGRL